MRTIYLAMAILLCASGYAQEEGELEKAQSRLVEAAKELARLGAHVPRPDQAHLGIFVGEQGETGIVVGGVSPFGGAEAAGLKEDDVIVEIDGTSLRGHRRPLTVLRGTLDEISPGDTVNLVVVRDGETERFDVVTSPYSMGPGVQLRWFDNGPHQAFDTERWRLWPETLAFGHAHRGLRLVDMGEDLGGYFGVDAGVLVVDTPAGSELKPGDVVKRIDGADVSSSSDAYRRLRRLDEDAEVEVRRKNRKVTVTVPASAGRPGAVDAEVEIEVDRDIVPR